MFAVSTTVLPKNLLDTIKRSAFVYSMLRRARFNVGTLMGARMVPGIPGRCHYNDFMLPSTSANDAARYYSGGVAFVDILERALHAAGRDWSDVDRCLDIGCGYGRIVRAVKERIPASRIYGSDVIAEGAAFTASEFGANAMPPIEQAGEEYRESFDLAYLLSVYTHMRREDIAANVRACAAALKPGGVLVFTIHGEVSARGAERYGHAWLDRSELNQSLSTQGYYYVKYPYYYDDYGMTWLSQDSVKKLVRHADQSLSFVSCEPGAVDAHQDVFVYQKIDRRDQSKRRL